MGCLFSPGILEPGSGGWLVAGEGTRDRSENGKTLRNSETTARDKLTNIAKLELELG